MLFDHLVLAGGGHSHALMLMRWAANSQFRPKGLITLVNRNSTTIYSGMFPGVIAREYCWNDAQIDLRVLADRAEVVLVIDEILGLNAKEKTLFLKHRPNLNFSRISLDFGSSTNTSKFNQSLNSEALAIPIKPFNKALDFIKSEDIRSSASKEKTFSVIGAGFAGLEIAFALRKRWPERPLQLQFTSKKLSEKIKNVLISERISLVERDVPISGPALLCTGNQPPEWIKNSGLPLEVSGRISTLATFQSTLYPYVFAVGDCGVLKESPRPPSGVWAVRAASKLARNIERQTEGKKLLVWKPQKRALQIVGGPFKPEVDLAWAFWGEKLIGPHPWIWFWKKFIDRRFMRMFDDISMMASHSQNDDEKKLCRGCAAKLASEPLREALKESNVNGLENNSEDAALVFKSSSGENLIQSVDGFPSLISDPWLNARLTALHACSDIWATGGVVISAQPIVTLPAVPDGVQKELLVQVLGGIRSALEPQDARIIGGHTLESRSQTPGIIANAIQISLSVNGLISSENKAWNKNGLQEGDVILLSRSLGSGVIFAASMQGAVDPSDLDFAIAQMNLSQHSLLLNLFNKQSQQCNSDAFHACTDITGFGLLGHLWEMLSSSNSKLLENELTPLKIILMAEAIPSFPGVLRLLAAGHRSTFASANRRFWRLFEPKGNMGSWFEWDLGNIPLESKHHQQIMELIVDPQTCGPLCLACSSSIADELIDEGAWIKIGSVHSI
ncbi:selenide, water dikinase SelD [Prochlorococcus sp. MIT 1223]|uniref:selenide, water dikinase SelD n=1 Tax=Prochlorococcus sp. MIT 1223 TaxID=3096217 RepID=UPI002A751977|nr:selenide, water dikinase SelD [Prochlorococcus sp. MIT 1223]